MYLPELTIPYKTYLKATLVQGLAKVFFAHPDNLLRTVVTDTVENGVNVIKGVKIALDFPKTKSRYPSVIVRFYEREIVNAGVGHEEYILVGENATIPQKFLHYFYSGDIEFAIYGLSSPDRDLIADTVVQTIAMGSLQSWTNNFFERVYADPAEEPTAAWHYVNINRDRIQGYGETQTPVPWQSEDDQLYQTSYRVGMNGEFYSQPNIVVPAGFIEQVDLFPYIGGLEPVPTGSDDPAPWIMGDDLNLS